MVIEEKLELLRAVEAENRFGNVITPGERIPPNPELPDGTTELFSLFGRLEGSNFLFKPAWSIRTPGAWPTRGTDNSPLGESLEVGAEIYSRPEYLPGDGEEIEDAVGYGGASVSMRLSDGRVRYIDPEDYIAMYDGLHEEDAKVVDLAPDLVTFFDRFVLGGAYPRLVDVVLGEGMSDGRNSKTGEFCDSWRRLLVAAGLSG